MKSTESDVCYFEVDAVFYRETVELLEESTWTAGEQVTTRARRFWAFWSLEMFSTMHVLRLLAVCWRSAKRAQDKHVLACNFAKYSPILKICPLADSAINLS